MNDLSQAKMDIYQTITASIIAAIEAGAGSFAMPWHGGGVTIVKPENASTRMEYHGVNVLMLWARAYAEGYPTGYWASYRQWQKLGAQVEKGAKATPIVFYKEIEREAEPEGEEATTRLFARASRVFNAAQVRGWTPPENRHPKGQAEVAANVAAFIEATKATIVWGGTSAHYHIPSDTIHMPDQDRFRDTEAGSASEGMQSVQLHELLHWSGAKHRLARFEDGLRREDVPFEELVAEIGSAFLCADLGVSVTPRPDHAAYVESWLAELDGDTKAIFRAARMATQATNYLHGLAETPPW